jgi:hypothetical protein
MDCGVRVVSRLYADCGWIRSEPSRKLAAAGFWVRPGRGRVCGRGPELLECLATLDGNQFWTECCCHRERGRFSITWPVLGSQLACSTVV